MRPQGTQLDTSLGLGRILDLKGILTRNRGLCNVSDLFVSEKNDKIRVFTKTKEKRFIKLLYSHIICKYTND